MNKPGCRMMIVVVMAALASCPSAFAQKSTAGAPLELEVDPPLALAGAELKVSGRAFAIGEGAKVRIDVIGPGPGKRVVEALIDPKSGAFETRLAAGTAQGTMTITATAPDGKSSASAKVAVTSAAGLTDAHASQGTAALTVGVESVALARDLVINLPPSPPAEEAREQLKQLEKALGQGKQHLADLAEGLSVAVQSLLADPAAMSAAADNLEDVARWTAQTDDAVLRARDRLKGLRGEYTSCDRLDAVREAFATLSLLLNAVKTGADLVTTILTDHVVPRVISVQDLPGPDAAKRKELATRAQKLIPPATKGLDSMIESAEPGALEIGQMIEKKVFARYCVKYEGPVAATMNAKFLAGSKVWWAYGVRLDGRLTLRYPKDTGVVESIRLTGEIEGNATDFAFSENITLIEPLPLGAVVMLRMPIEPIPFVAQGGDPFGLGLVRIGTPAYFRVPVEGRLVRDTIVLELLDAAVDFSDAVSNRLVLIMVSSLSPLPIPEVMTFKFPIPKAQFILTRGIDQAAAKPEFPVKVQGKAASIERRFEREWWNDARDIRINWVVKIAAKNDGE